MHITGNESVADTRSMSFQLRAVSLAYASRRGAGPRIAVVSLITWDVSIH